MQGGRGGIKMKNKLWFFGAIGQEWGTMIAILRHFWQFVRPTGRRFFFFFLGLFTGINQSADGL